MAQTTEDAKNAYTAWGLMKCKSKLELLDDDLFLYYYNHLAGEMECKNQDCNCLLILEDEFARKAVAGYLVLFEGKLKYDQDYIILEWFRYSTSTMREGNTRGPNKGRTNYYQLPYDGNYVDDDKSLQVLRNHRLCTAGMQAVMSIGYDSLELCLATHQLEPRGIRLKTTR